jgi:transcriptional regulator with PAS, ATPase and Fis domain
VRWSPRGSFRDDLYYRANVIDMVLPPLRDRGGDIELLAIYFLRRYGSSGQAAVKGFEPEAMIALETYAWPGNVRELQNVIERACALAEGEMITLAELPTHCGPRQRWETGHLPSIRETS